MSPGNDEGHPRARAALQVENPDDGSDVSNVRHAADAVADMQRLVADLDAHRREVVDAYRDGFNAGWDVGYGYRLHEEEAAWTASRDTRGPGVLGTTTVERVALDAAYALGLPCPTPHASGCSRCIRAATVARRGGDYQGGPVEWEPRPTVWEVA